MRIHSITGAEYFCRGFEGKSAASDVLSVVSSWLDGGRRDATEGSRAFDDYRDALTRETDQALLLSIALFRRALDGVTPASCFWLNVTLYYSSWLAARAILGLHGCWWHGFFPRGSGSRSVKHLHVEVSATTPGSLEVVVQRSHAAALRGSHQTFWNVYYRAVAPLVSWVDPAMVLAVRAVNSDPTWAIDQRNTLNYSPVEAFQLIEPFSQQFEASRFPESLPGSISTQFLVTRAMLLFAADRVAQYDFGSDVFTADFGSRVQAIEKLVYDAPLPDLVHAAERMSLVV